MVLPLALAGCSGTRIGETLSRSFSGAPPTPAAGSPLAGAGGPASPATGSAAPASGPAASSSAASTGKPPAAPQGKAGATAPTATAGTATTTVPPAAGSPAAAPLPRQPAPYRVTILLSQADASAPAEVVTQALRAAGVPFEVETIERIGAGSALSRQGAAVPSSQAAPTVRSAPAPR